MGTSTTFSWYTITCFSTSLIIYTGTATSLILILSTKMGSFFLFAFQAINRSLVRMASIFSASIICMIYFTKFFKPLSRLLLELTGCSGFVLSVAYFCSSFRNEQSVSFSLSFSFSLIQYFTYWRRHLISCCNCWITRYCLVIMDQQSRGGNTVFIGVSIPRISFESRWPLFCILLQIFSIFNFLKPKVEIFTPPPNPFHKFDHLGHNLIVKYWCLNKVFETKRQGEEHL